MLTMTLPQFLGVSAVVGIGWCFWRLNRITGEMVAAQLRQLDEWNNRDMFNEAHVRPAYQDHHWNDPDVQSCEAGGMLHSFRSGVCVFCQGAQCPVTHRHDGRCLEAVGHPGRAHRGAQGRTWVLAEVDADA